MNKIEDKVINSKDKKKIEDKGKDRYDNIIISNNYVTLLQSEI